MSRATVLRCFRQHLGKVSVNGGKRFESMEKNDPGTDSKLASVGNVHNVQAPKIAPKEPNGGTRPSCILFVCAFSKLQILIDNS